MTVGEFIKQKRIAKGLTIEQLSQLCNSNDSAFSRIENNKRDIEFSLLVNLCKVLDFTPNELAEKTGFTPPAEKQLCEQKEMFSSWIEELAEKTAKKTAKETARELKEIFFSEIFSSYKEKMEKKFKSIEEEIKRLPEQS